MRPPRSDRRSDRARSDAAAGGIGDPGSAAPSGAGAPAIEARPARHVRLVFVLAIAALLGTFAVYTALIGDTTPLIGVAEAAAGKHHGESVRLDGKVLSHSGDAASAAGLRIVLQDNETASTVSVVYHGSVPDAFRDGRGVVVDGKLAGGTFLAVKDSLVTKCPSKYAPTSSTPTTPTIGS